VDLKKRKQEKPLAAYDPETETIYISEELLNVEKHPVPRKLSLRKNGKGCRCEKLPNKEMDLCISFVEILPNPALFAI